ncbi:MAG: ABC transporter permease [Armatimonadota bacterium]|nr:ABC transporter permease [Armatimonadota bacterium]MDR7435713.1 ABC transporter permease [Armatimonadota bacterium]
MDVFVLFSKLVMLTLVPYVLASQGTMLGGRAGVFNVAQEGIMLAGASVGFLGAYLSGGNLVQGALLAMVMGGLFGLALAYFTTTLKMDQFVIGLALFFIGLALSTLLYKLVVGVTLTPPLIPTLQELPLPGLSHIPVLGEVLFKQNILVYLAILLSLALYVFLYHTGPGMALRAVGENPMAADSLGVNVSAMRYLATISGSMLIGLAGAYLPMVYTGTFTEGMVRGRGWLSIALTFFGGWSPHLIFLGSLFFAAVEVLAFRVQVTGVGVPYQFVLMLPYVATILVMLPTFRRLRIPAFLGRNYDRERRALL